MPWARVHDGAYTHPKFVGLPPAAIGLWCMGLSFANHQLTDGFIPRAQVPRLVSGRKSTAIRLARVLVAARLWEEYGLEGYQIHDFLDWNESAKAIREKRNAIAKVRSTAGRLGGLRSAEVRRSKAASKAEANASGVLKAKRSPLHSTNPPIVPPSPWAGASTTNGDDANAAPRRWMPPPGTIYHDGCAKPGFAHLFPPERRAQCPKHQVGQEKPPEEPGR